VSEQDLPEGVIVEHDSDTVSATITVDAPPSEVFEFIRTPANHPEISGDHTVKGKRAGPELLGEGDRFGMDMKVYGVPYRVRSTVVEYVHGTKIAWAHMGGHRWRWELEPTSDGKTKLTETFDLTTARFPPALRLLGYPKRHLDNVAESVANVAAHFRAQ
jgi:uncharacterized protein YndB with AHSA1/START domain